MSYHQSKNRSLEKMISRIPSCWREDDHRCITYTGAWCKRATDKEVRSTRGERKGATIGTNVDNEQVVCYAKCLMHGLRKWRDTLTIEEEPNLRSQVNQGELKDNRLTPATWPRRYLEGMRVSRPHARTLPIPLIPMRSFEALAPPSVRQKKKSTSRRTKNGRWT